MVPCKRITGFGRSAELIAKEERISRTVDDEEGERNLLRIGRGKIFSYEINVIGIKRRAIINDGNSCIKFIQRKRFKEKLILTKNFYSSNF